MLIIYLIKNIFINTYKTIILIEIIKKSLKKNIYIKEFCLFIIFYIFLNLYLFPTIALCEVGINPDFLNRENNTYKGSKILYEKDDNIMTEKEYKAIKYFFKETVLPFLLVAFLAFSVISSWPDVPDVPDVPDA